MGRVALVLTFVAAVLGGCASVPPLGEVPDVQRTWDGAKVYLPGRLLATSVESVPADRRWPVVVYLHGCTGLTQHDFHWANTLKGLGFVVVQPDSFARANRKPNCDPRTYQLGAFPQAAEMRDEEVRYAVERAKSAPWADPARVFVMGHSEGGRTAMTNVVSGVRGTIISGWGCTSARRQWNGIPHPSAHPTLIFEYESDPWYARRGGSCKNHLNGRSATTHVVLGPSGHGSVESPLARAAAEDFLRKLLP
jgi:dienelactone hydrolase